MQVFKIVFMWYWCENHNFVFKKMSFNRRLQIYKNIYEYKLSFKEKILFKC